MSFHKKSFEALLQPHIRHIYQVAYRFCGNTHDSEDLIQDLLVKLYPQQEEMQSIEYLRAWILRVLYHLYLDTKRREQRSPMARLDDDESKLDSVVDTSLSPEALVENDFTQQRLTDALTMLNDKHRVLVILSDVEGYSLKELATILDTPIGTVKSRLSRARSQLRILLSTEPSQQNYRSNN